MVNRPWIIDGLRKLFQRESYLWGREDRISYVLGVERIG